MDLGTVDQVGIEAKKLGARKVLFVTDRGLSNAGVARQIKKLVEAEGVQVVPVGGVESNRFITSLAEGMKIYQSNQCDTVATGSDVEIVLL
jgi:alcohol dehydrogenase